MFALPLLALLIAAPSSEGRNHRLSGGLPLTSGGEDAPQTIQTYSNQKVIEGTSKKDSSKAIDDKVAKVIKNLDKPIIKNGSTPVNVIPSSNISPKMHSDGSHATRHQKRRATIEDYIPSLLAMVTFTGVVLCAYILAKGFPYIGLPLVSGYLAIGILCGPHILGFVTPRAIRNLRIVDEVALAFIALTAGAQLDLNKMKKRSSSIQLTTALLVLTAFVFGAVTLFSLRASITFMRDMGVQQCWAVAMLGAVLLVARSPASAIAIRKEMGADGPFTSTVMGVTIIMDVVVIVLFALIDLLANGMLSDSGPNLALLGIFVSQMVISVVIGLVLGVAVLPSLLYDEKIFSSVGSIGLASRTPWWVKTLLQGAACFVTLFMGFSVFFASHALEPFLEPLIICMLAGFGVRNFTKSGPAFQTFEDIVAPGVNAAFFTLTGCALAVNALIGPVMVLVLVLFLVRLFAIAIGAYVAGRVAGDSHENSRVAWMAYITQAGVALGLAKKIHVEYHTWGTHFATTMIAVVVINQLVGPPFFRFVLRYVGEAGKVLPPEADARLVVDDEESKKTSKLPKTNDVHPVIPVHATAITSATPVSKATVSVH